MSCVAFLRWEKFAAKIVILTRQYSKSKLCQQQLADEYPDLLYQFQLRDKTACTHQTITEVKGKQKAKAMTKMSAGKWGRALECQLSQKVGSRPTHSSSTDLGAHRPEVRTHTKDARDSPGTPVGSSRGGNALSKAILFLASAAAGIVGTADTRAFGDQRVHDNGCDDRIHRPPFGSRSAGVQKDRKHRALEEYRRGTQEEVETDWCLEDNGTEII